MAHPRHRLDDAFQTPIRFSLMAALGDDLEMDFGALRELLESENSVLSKAVSYLEKDGYVRVTKGYLGTRPRTWIAPTAKGRRAYREHLRALREIAGDVLG
ncbi:transcriptional regulator [Compostimonas suwonensis]|uniref:Winged helix DNA-binding protein n=1 Tax=Compostimonas suwonensis TaxID=1048394 RepID=A0A2M9BTY8_9MICO|nr:transcriptional regulator [Compostimonas suwonensis]PJJ61372.1 winged helix DNA-binding protein [Compostimonas suwonensis]